MVVAVRRRILSLVDLRAGPQVRIGIENGRGVPDPRIRPHYTLGELLAKSPRKALKPSREDREWLSGGPVGKEAI